MVNKYSEWQKDKYYNDDGRYKLKRKMANAIRKGLKGNKMLTGALMSLDYDIDDLKIKLEKEYDGEIDWEYLGKTLDIDHCIPDSWFDYNDVDDVEFELAWDIENLRLMGRIENREKKNVSADPSEKQLKTPRIRKILERNGYFSKAF